jgi:hypothetical protein
MLDGYMCQCSSNFGKSLPVALFFCVLAISASISLIFSITPILISNRRYLRYLKVMCLPQRFAQCRTTLIAS